MPYANQITRAKAAPLVTEEVSRAMLGRGGGVEANSAVLQMFRRVPVSHSQVRFPILSALPLAYWVSGDTGLKQTTEAAWANKFLNIEELACIVPVPENVLDDQDFDLWGEIQPEIEIAIGRALDAAVLFGTNAPGTFPAAVAVAALAAGNSVTEGATAAQGGISDDLDQLIGLIETDGFDPTGIMAARSLRGKLRRARNTLGDRLSNVDGKITEYDGLPISTPARGLFPVGGSGLSTRAIVGDFANEFVVGVRSDITLKILDQAVITDAGGLVVVNLPQQDMIALRVTFRVGWQVSNRINFDQPTEANRYPAGQLIF